MDTMTVQEIENSLHQFYGTEEYHRWSALFPFVLTDGAKFVADACQAYWLMDAIASWQIQPKVFREDFQVWTLTKTGGRSASLVCDDGNGNKVASQKIGYTDFPLPEIVLWFIDGVVLLPSEY